MRVVEISPRVEIRYPDDMDAYKADALLAKQVFHSNSTGLLDKRILLSDVFLTLVKFTDENTIIPNSLELLKKLREELQLSELHIASSDKELFPFIRSKLEDESIVDTYTEYKTAKKTLAARQGATFLLEDMEPAQEAGKFIVQPLEDEFQHIWAIQTPFGWENMERHEYDVEVIGEIVEAVKQVASELES